MNPLFKGGYGIYNDVPEEFVREAAVYADRILGDWAMKKLPTVKISGKTAWVIDRTHIEDDIAAAEAISRDAARYRWLRDNFEDDAYRLVFQIAIPRKVGEDIDAAIDTLMNK